MTTTLLNTTNIYYNINNQQYITEYTSIHQINNKQYVLNIKI